MISGKSVALLITLTPWAWFSDWKDGKLKHRGDDYNALKDKIGHQMWKQTEELFPQLAGTVCYFICLFCCFTSQVNGYGHGGTLSSPNHTFSWASLNKQLTSTSCTYFRLLPTATLLE